MKQASLNIQSLIEESAEILLDETDPVMIMSSVIDIVEESPLMDDIKHYID